MWGHHSASEIAEHIGGLTRNAVIGKAHRLKLSIQKSADMPGTGLQMATGGMGAIKSSRKRMLRHLPMVPTPSAAASMRVLPTARDIFRSLEGIGGAVRSEGIAMTKAGDRHCRWPGKFAGAVVQGPGSRRHGDRLRTAAGRRVHRAPGAWPAGRALPRGAG